MRQLFNAKLDTVNYKLRQVLQSATRLIATVPVHDILQSSEALFKPFQFPAIDH